MATKHKELAYAHIRRKLLLGEIKMGSRLREGTIAREIGISRTPVREALNQLDAEGLIDLVRNRGAFVQTLSRRDVKELYSLRILLEGYAASEAAERVTPEQLDQLFEFCDRMHGLCHQLRQSDWMDFPDKLKEQWMLTDVAFHLMLLDISACHRTAKIVSDMRILTQLCGRGWISPEKYRRMWYYQTWGDHLRIARALRRRDGQAAGRAMRKHLTGAMEGVLRHFPRHQGEQGQYDLPESIRRKIGQMEHFTGSRHKGD